MYPVTNTYTFVLKMLHDIANLAAEREHGLFTPGGEAKRDTDTAEQRVDYTRWCDAGLQQIALW